jgi:hypothetical protein
MATQGRNVWYDLMTTDLDAAKRFYESVIGWKTDLFEKSDPANPYFIWLADAQPVGGVMAQPADERAMGVPPHWMAHTTVDDVDAAAKKVVSLGGKVMAPPWNIPTVGRVSVVADPQGAVFSLYKPEQEVPPAKDGLIGGFGWAELNTTDYESAWPFYSALFGWKHRESVDMGDGFTYFMFNDASEQTQGGMSNAATMMKAPPHWAYYITVKDVNETIARIKEHGGKILNGPMEVPGNDTIANCLDPQGAMFSIFMKGRPA